MKYIRHKNGAEAPFLRTKNELKSSFNFLCQLLDFSWSPICAACLPRLCKEVGTRWKWTCGTVWPAAAPESCISTMPSTPKPFSIALAIFAPPEWYRLQLQDPGQAGWLLEFRNDQSMTIGLWHDVHKCKNLVIFIHFNCWKFTTQNSCKNILVIVSHKCIPWAELNCIIYSSILSDVLWSRQDVAALFWKFWLGCVAIVIKLCFCFRILETETFWCINDIMVIFQFLAFLFRCKNRCWSPKQSCRTDECCNK